MSDAAYSSDEAPEELTFTQAKAQSKKETHKRQQAEREQRHALKKKRKERDDRLKQQQAASHSGQKKKLLSEVLQEEDDDEDNEQDAGATPREPQAEREARIAEAVRAAKAQQKKRFTDVKDGIRVQVIEPASITKRKRLPPPATAAVSRREKFLFRESITRK